MSRLEYNRNWRLKNPGKVAEHYGNLPQSEHNRAIPKVRDIQSPLFDGW